MAAEIAAVEVNRGLLKELEDLGFSMARAAWALHHSGNSNLETAVNWIIDHENDSQFDTMPLVEFNIEIESPNPSETSQAREKELKEQARKMREEEEKENMQISSFASQSRNIDVSKAEKDEEKKARLQKVNADKLDRKRKLRLPTEGESASTLTPVAPLDPTLQRTTLRSLPSKAEEMRECLRSLKRNHKDEDPRVTRRAFETLLMIVRNAAMNPDEEKYRRIRLTNHLFQERVGRFKQGTEFLELCGFRKKEGSEFLSLSTHDADIIRLREAASQLQSAITNPFFGLLSKKVQD